MTSHNPTRLRQASNRAHISQKPDRVQVPASPASRPPPPAGKPSLTLTGASKAVSLNDPPPPADIRVWGAAVPVPCRSRTAATASCWVSREPAADTWPKRSAPLKDAAKAHRIVETGHSGGKVILIL